MKKLKSKKNLAIESDYHVRFDSFLVLSCQNRICIKLSSKSMIIAYDQMCLLAQVF